jgi:outer membrane protein TolC
MGAGWGRIRSLNEAALQQFLAVESNVRAARNSIMQQTVQSYLTLSELDKRIHFAQRSVQNYEKSVRIFKRRFEWVQALKWNTCKQKQCSVMVKL